MKEKTLRIAHLGVKGIPAYLGGIEHTVEEIAKRQVKQGHDVTVYARPWYNEKKISLHDGIKIIECPTVPLKATDSIVFGITSTTHASLFKHYDVLHFHELVSHAYSFFPRLFKTKTVVTFRAPDWENPKWGEMGMAFLKLVRFVGIHSASQVTTVSPYVKKVLEGKFKRQVTFIPNGVDILPLMQPEIIKQKYNLQGNDYLFFIGRFEEPKRIDWLIKAFLDTGVKDCKLVISGGAKVSESKTYEDKLRREFGNHPQILFTGFVKGQEKEELFSNAALFVSPSLIEGCPNVLLEALSYGRVCLVSDIPAHTAIVEDEKDGFLFKTQDYVDFVKKLKRLIENKENICHDVARNAQRKVKTKFNWDTIVSHYEHVYLKTS